jgi:glycosyltransferase involved in cell wall biosynthesis
VRPRVLFVGATRYELPLAPPLRRKYDAIERELDYRVLARGRGGDERFRLVEGSAGFYARLPLLLRRTVRELRPDAVVAEDPRIGALALLARVRPVIVEVHGNPALSTRLYGSPARRLLSPLGDLLVRFALRRADAVRALSPYTAALVEQVRGRPPDAAFPAYVDVESFARRPVQPLPRRPTALFVGVLELYKNVDGLAAAWRKAATRLPDAKLVVVGKGSRASLFERLAAELPEQVEYVPQLSADEVAVRLDEATVLVLPSRSEGLPRIAIESLARGRGVVGSREGGTRDLVRHAVEGLLVDPDDTDELADALVRVLSDRELAERLGAAAAAAYDAWRSSPEEVATRLRALVEAALH